MRVIYIKISCPGSSCKYHKNSVKKRYCCKDNYAFYYDDKSRTLNVTNYEITDF